MNRSFLLFCIASLLLVACGSDPSGSDPDVVEYPEYKVLMDIPFGELTDFRIVGDRLYTTNYYGLMIYDIADPEHLVLQCRLATRGEARRLAVVDELAFIADGRGGLKIVDASDPVSPRVLGVVAIPGEAQAVDIHGHLAVVGSNRADSIVFDISEPEAPVQIGTVEGLAADIVFHGDLLLTFGTESNDDFRCTSSALRVVDMADPARALQVGRIDFPERCRPPPGHLYLTPNAGWGLVAAGDYAYLGSDDGKVLVLDLSDPTAPVEAGRFYSGGHCVRGLDLQNENLMVATSEDLLEFDLDDPESPTKEDQHPLPRGAYLSEIAVEGSYLLTADSLGALTIFDVGTLASPRQVLQIELVEDYNILSTPGLGLADGLALVAYSETLVQKGGLLIVDPGKPAQPVIGSLHVDDDLKAVAVDGQVVYLVGGQMLLTVDIGDPARPEIIGCFNDSNLRARNIALDGHHAFVISGGTSGVLKVFDIGDPALPLEVGQFPLAGVNPGRPGIAARDGLVFVASGTYGLVILDASDPGSPKEIGTWKPQTGDFLCDVAVDYPYAFLSAGMRIHVLDISDPASPAEVQTLDTPGHAQRIAFSGDAIFVGDTYDLVVYSFSGKKL
ncbi:MAG: hypothetical protein JRJ87_17175 [Deltaproteobacteria bacterium]|nr:hypothetical protein [Deltaproteobacteria bacterium]